MSHNKVKVLIVDDEQVICDLLHDELSERGYSCRYVLKAKDALSKLRMRYFDAALVDIRLPGVSGIELLKKIRLYHHNTAVIMITAINNIDTAVEAIRLGAADYIVKPFNIDKIVSSIETALESRENLLAKEAGKITSPMDAIAYGVEAKLDLRDGHLKTVTQRTIDVARWFGIDEAEIERWATARTRFDCLNRMPINSLLKKMGQDPTAQSIADGTRIYLQAGKSQDSEN
jgi:DNA-binding response OmpR family regulator